MREPLDSERSPSRIESVMAAVRARIAARTMLAGARLPSVRAQAKAMGVSVSTVVEAYERLAAEGIIVSRPGSGFYVTGAKAPLSLAGIGPQLDRAIDPLWISRQSLEAGPDLPKPGCGWLPASWLREAGIARALRTIGRASAAETVTDYASPHGLSALRGLLARRMAGNGIDASTEQIMLTESGTQAIDLICRLLLQPGDVVLVDDPCYFNFHALLKAHRAKVVSVPYLPNGPDVAAFETVLREHAPRLYITNSGIHNPTGATLSPVTAHRILKLAEAAGLVIVEDDIFADFEVSPAPRLAAFDGLDRVMHIGSFSKTLSASVRCGYIAGRRDWIESLVDLKIATSFGGGRLAAEILHRALTDGSYRKHMEQVRMRLAGAMGKAIDQLASLGIRPWLVPRAGMLLWCRLPGDLDAGAVARECLREGIVMAPGNSFSLSQSAGSFMRFNVAQLGDPRVYSVLARALETVSERDAST